MGGEEDSPDERGRPRRAGGDDELMARAGEGDRQAWHLLYVRHRDAVFRAARRFLGDEAAARDVTQDVFVSVFAHAKGYRPTASFATYLRRVTVNRCINVRSSAWEAHRAEKGDTAPHDDADRSPDPETALGRRETEEMVRRAIAALPGRQRMAVVLSRFEGLSYAEIADALGCSVSSVESLLFRARQALARILSGT